MDYRPMGHRSSVSCQGQIIVRCTFYTTIDKFNVTFTCLLQALLFFLQGDNKGKWLGDEVGFMLHMHFKFNLFVYWISIPVWH